ncbi:nephrocystin-1 isoform X1 [Osmerus eperlanus]|uniref:nephrocystin-1 isoform X1 n=1 Tax=Osmerus eperlanus TaxID=29151 RepID=UPI002E0DBD1C
MAPKRKGPLQTVQREADEIKRQVDSLVKHVRQGNGQESTQAPQRCKQLQSTLEETMKTLNKLTKADEPAPVGNYDQRKQEEERRLLGLAEQLKALSLEVSPALRLGLEAGVAGPSKADDDDSEEEEESEEDDDDDDDEDDYESEEDIPEPGDDIYISISALKGQQEGDLTITEGEILKVLKKNENGWWLAQNSQSKQGLVPKTYLQKYSDVDDEDDEEDSEDEELSEAKGNRSSDPQSNWTTVRKAVTQIDTTDVLSAMGAIPAGFRPSTLSKLLDESIAYRAGHYIQPELSQSKLSFKDLFLDPDTGKVRAREVRASVCVTLWSCKIIPTPGVGVNVLSRHVRFCVFSGVQVLSNIHTVRATYNSKHPKTWSFSPKMTGPLASLLDGECFLRCNSDSADLGILFELGVTFIRNSTGERGNLSCGWAFLKLFDANGALIPPRTYELTVNGGTPYETDVAVDPSVPLQARGGLLQQMLQARKHPKLTFKLKSPKGRTRAQLSVLPDTLVGCLSGVHLLALHRQLLAETLLMDRASMQNADVICSPLLATFSEVVDQPDLLDALRTSWLDAERDMTRADKRDLQKLKRAFVKVYMDTVYHLLCSAGLPDPRWGDDQVEEQRARVIYACLHLYQGPNQSPSDGRSGPQAFDISQLSYDLLHMAR